MDYQGLLERVCEETRPLAGKGHAADYIPALAEISTDHFGMALIDTKGGLYSVGDADIPFSIQSISKVFTLTLALRELGNEVWSRVGREPSGHPFNSLIQLENEQGIPRNPFINAGALVVADMLLEAHPDPRDKILTFVRMLSANNSILIDERVALSEKRAAHRNAALTHFMKSFGNIGGEVEDVLNLYCNHCSIAMSCIDLARAFRFLAQKGIHQRFEEPVLTFSLTKRLNSLMMTSGLYNESGEFAYRVGLPAKSGVGGGIVAVLPGHFSMAAWGPGLNERGNSLRGIEALDRFTTISGLSIF
ncbi:MAG TPA: glutaminase [Firmicutes bacterium]|nr:glutaminase [Bacillota bacterium]